MCESSDGELRVLDNPAGGRYEAYVGDSLAGFVTYSRSGRQVTFTHTLVEPAFEGQGIGGRLAAGALDDVRGRGDTVVARCPFVAEYIRRHPAYWDLMAPEAPV
jgi:hypothetical protein